MVKINLWQIHQHESTALSDPQNNIPLNAPKGAGLSTWAKSNRTAIIT
jgi:hypothetical protein